jgi:hypothetical protein
MTRQTQLGTAVAFLAGALIVTAVELRAATVSANAISQPEVDAITAGIINDLATDEPVMVEHGPDCEHGPTVQEQVRVWVARHETPPDRSAPWYWHVATTCQECTESDDTLPDGLTAVHSDSGWARSKKAARAATHLLLTDMLDLA